MSYTESRRAHFIQELEFRNEFPRTADNDYWLAAVLAKLGGLASAW